MGFLGERWDWRFGVAWNSYEDSVLLKFFGSAESGWGFELGG